MKIFPKIFLFLFLFSGWPGAGPAMANRITDSLKCAGKQAKARRKVKQGYALAKESYKLARNPKTTDKQRAELTGRIEKNKKEIEDAKQECYNTCEGDVGRICDPH